jgi:hypothetical protein
MRVKNEEHREIILLALSQLPLKGTPEQIRGALREVEEVVVAVKTAEVEEPDPALDLNEAVKNGDFKVLGIEKT